MFPLGITSLPLFASYAKLCLIYHTGTEWYQSSHLLRRSTGIFPKSTINTFVLWVHVLDFMSDILSIYGANISAGLAHLFLILVFAFRGWRLSSSFQRWLDSRKSLHLHTQTHTFCTPHTSPYELCHSPQDCFPSCWDMRCLNHFGFEMKMSPLCRINPFNVRRVRKQISSLIEIWPRRSQHNAMPRPHWP